MRIVSWNMNGKVVNLRKLMNAIGASACLIQEPTASIDVTGGTGRSADPSHTTWTGVRVPGSCAQDNYYFAYNQNFACTYHLTEPDPRGSDTIEDGYGRNYLIVKLKGGGQSVRMATFHAPYGLAREDRDNRNITAVEYLQALIGGGLTYTRPDKPGRVGPPPAAKLLDLILADTNVYDNGDCNRLAWPCVLNSPTGNGRDGGSLDRIFMRPGVFRNYRCGRIYVTGKAPRISSIDRRGGNVTDIEVPDEAAYQEWMKSDHLAIYFDTDSTTDVLPALAPGSGAKAKRSDDDLQELDDKGKARKLNTEEVLS